MSPAPAPTRESPGDPAHADLARPSAPAREAVGRATVRLLPATERAAARAAWAAIEARAARVPLACSWAWTGTWLEHYGDAVPHRFAIVERGGVPCGAALVCRSVRRHGPISVRALHLGTAGEPEADGVLVEHNSLLAAAGAAPAVAVALAGALRAEPGWDELRLDGFVPADAQLLLGAEPAPRATIRREPAPWTSLAGVPAGGDVLDALARGPRARIRRSLRALGDVECEWATDAAHARDILDELAALHQERWTRAGERGAFAGARFTAFHRALVARLAGQGTAALFRVRAGARTVGCLYGLVDGPRLLFYQSGFGVFADNRIRPGLVSHALFMGACRERGLEAYDFLAGDHRYKRELATHAGELWWASARRPHARLRLLDAGRAARRMRSAA